MPTFYNSIGNEIHLGEKIGSGGEGNVYRIISAEKWVAKIYHQAIDQEKQQKIKAMIRTADETLQKVTAWPLDSLHKTKNGAVCGFIMPDIMDYEPLHHIYSPSHRKQQFPEIDWAFLINVCRNIASAFGAIHAKGHVIGDVNPNLVFISKQTIARLIDCDSFQISFAGKTYPCEVGVAHFTPPELQGLASFKDLPRTTNHDNFGLALLIFHVLMMGRHPFSGIYSGKTHRSLEKSIQHHLYAFSDKSAIKNQISPPPNSIKPNILSDKLTLLFEKSFSEFGSKFHRPSAKEWVSALDSFQQQIQSCTQSKNHKYYNRLSNCPWCEAEAKGASYFPVLSSGKINLKSGFDKDSIWKKIIAIPAPKDKQLNIRSQLLYFSKKVKATPIPRKSLARKQKIVFKKIFAVLIIAIWYLFFPTTVLLSLIPATYLFFSKINLNPERLKRKERVEQAEKQLFLLLKQWDKEGSVASFYQKKDTLKKCCQQYNKLNEYYQCELDLLKKNKRELQLNAFLEKFYINNSSIKGIGAVRKSDLASFGIETAADVLQSSVIRVPGFGAKTTKKMIDWRKGIERQFIFNPAIAIDPLEISKVKTKVSNLKRNLENQLLSGPRQLTEIHNNILKKREILLPKISTAVENIAQAKIDLQFLENNL